MAAISNFKMAATRGCEYVGGIFCSSPWVGLPLCKVSCLLQKLNDSGALPLYYEVKNDVNDDDEMRFQYLSKTIHTLLAFLRHTFCISN